MELVAPGRHTLLSSAAAWYQAGACVLPVATDGSKRPGLPAWKGYQAVRPSEQTVVDWMQAAEGIGLVTGEVSGRLEMLELEGRAVALGLEDDLAALVEARAPGLWAKATTYSERTPSGGLHLLYRLDGPVASNTALAHMPDPEDPKRSLVLIETRGEGGFVVVAPSNGRTHRSGGAWRVEQGEPGQVPTLTADEHAVLHECARALDGMPPKPEREGPRERPEAAADALRPGEDYNRRGPSWAELLEAEGWRIAVQRGEVTHWVRPGKDPRDGASATTGWCGNKLYVFSTSAGLPVGQALDKFRVYAELHHGGDLSAAARQLRRQGYGSTRPLIVVPEPEPAPGPRDRALLDRLVDHMRQWMDATDLSHVTFACAVSVSAADDDGEPLWGQIVGPPSSGKTEAVRSQDEVANDRVDELTAAALLSWHKVGRGPAKPTGVLARLGDNPRAALLTVGDFSTVLATSDKGLRDQLFALLRRVYDGSVSRDLGNAPTQLRWTGQLTILSAVTPAIDDYSSHADALGPRWLYCRMPERPKGTRNAPRRFRRIPDLARLRAEARRLAREAVEAARTRLPDIDLDDDTLNALNDAAELVAAARGSVPRDGYGRREIIGLPVIEEPHRLRSQLQLLTRSLLALGLDRKEATELAVRCALDTVPRARLAVLSPLATGVVFTVSGLAQAAGGIERKVARMAAEELRALGIAACPVEDASEWDDPGREAAGRRDWQLADTELADLAQAVLCGTKSGDHPPIPPRDRTRRSPLISTDRDTPHFSSHCPTQLTTEGSQS